MTLAKPGATFLCGRKGPTGRIAERIMSSEVRENGAGPVRTGTHAGHTDIEMALRSKPEGDFLLLTRLVRCRRASGPTADDAVLTLRSLFLWLRENRGHHYLSGGICRSKRLARDQRQVQLTKRRSRTFITRPIARKTNNVAEPP